MAMSEIDSFVVKFKNLWHSGRNATLTIKSKAGKAEVTLQAELGDAPHPPAQLPNHHRVSRNGPARQRRRQRRAALGEAAIAGKATEVLDEKADVAEEKRKLGRLKILHLEKLLKQ